MTRWRSWPRVKRYHAVILMLVIALFYALATGATLYYRIIYLLGLAFLGSYAWSLLNSRGIRIEIERERSHVQVGDTIQERIKVLNIGPFPKTWLEVQELTTMPGGASGQVISLQAGGQRFWRVRISARQRGVYMLGPIRVSARDPFGLFHHSKTFPGTQEVVVYPAAVDLPYLNIAMSGMPEDGRQRQPVQRPTPHASGVREYLPSDSVSRIHWPTTARMGKLFVKQFDQGTGNDLWLLVDMQAAVQTGSGAESTDEYAVNVAASVAQKYLRSRVPVGLVAYGQERVQIPADQSPGQIARLLDALARVKADGSTPLAELLLGGRRQFQRNSTLMVVTPSADPLWVSALTPLIQGGSKVVVVMVDPETFGGRQRIQEVLDQLVALRVRTYVLKQGQPLGEALSMVWGVLAPASPEFAAVPI